MKTCQGLRARATSRSNSSGVSEIRSLPRLTRWPATSMVTSAMRSVSGRLLVAGPEPGPDAGHELGGLERLGHVVVGAGLEAADDVGGVRLGGQHHDRNVGLGADLAADFDAVHAGKHQVQQHEVRLRGAEDVQGLSAVSAEDRLEAVIAQHNTDHLGQRLVIVHYQNACLHSYIFPY